MLLVLNWRGQRHKVIVDSFASAREAFENARDGGDYGSRDMGWDCGCLYETTGSGKVGHISYNGRVWDTNGEEIQL